ncbi:uncharacterized protein TNCV_1362841 [Trichonephila clavipes]|nr:uncharacterized protein TNCV_1362841 [Trichonephila clavipes]
MISLAREGFGKINGVKRNNNKIIIADVPDAATTAMLVSTNASHDQRINKIELSDAFCNEDEIDHLLGVDLIGKLFTGKCVQLNFGLAAIHTILGWTVIGKETGLGSSNDEIAVGFSVQTFLSLYGNDISLK